MSPLAEVTQDGWKIQYLTPEQRTPEVCLAAVTQNGDAIQCLTLEQRTPFIPIADTDHYTLYWHQASDWFIAGCASLSRADALTRWDRQDNRAVLFTLAIRMTIV